MYTDTIAALLMPGRVVEIHGDENAPMHDMAAGAIKKLQEDGKLVCYLDGSGKSTLKNKTLDSLKTWYIFDMGILSDPSAMMVIADNCDAVVVDDITMYEGNIWRAMEMLSNAARHKYICVLVLNQRRHVFNHNLKVYEDKPYHLNVMERYCNSIVDANTGEYKEYGSEVEYDDFTARLLGRAG